MKKIIDYIDMETEKGYDQDTIRNKLLKAGYNHEIIEMSFRKFDEKRKIDLDIDNTPSFGNFLKNKIQGIKTIFKKEQSQTLPALPEMPAKKKNKEDIIPYIEKEYNKGYSIEKIARKLIRAGYQEEKINEFIKIFKNKHKIALSEFVKTQIGKGIKPEKIRKTLKKAGYSSSIIDQELEQYLPAHLKEEQPPQTIPSKEPLPEIPPKQELEIIPVRAKVTPLQTEEIISPTHAIEEPRIPEILREEEPKERITRFIEGIKNQIRQTFEKHPKPRLEKEVKKSLGILQYIEKEHKKGYPLFLVKKKLTKAGYSSEIAEQGIELYKAQHKKNLVKYIKSQRSKSIPLPQIKSNLLKSGYSESAIKESMTAYKDELVSMIPRPKHNIAIMVAVTILILLGGIIYVQQLFNPILPKQVVVMENPQIPMANQETQDLVEAFKKRAETEKKPETESPTSKLEELSKKKEETKQPTIAQTLPIEEKPEQQPVGATECDLTPDPSERDQCFLRMAQKNIDENYCYKIGKAEIKRSCINTINKVKVFIK